MVDGDRTVPIDRGLAREYGRNVRSAKPEAVVHRIEYAVDDDPTCSFCKRKRSIGNRRMVAGPDGVYICDECVDLCVEVLEEERH